MPKGTRTFRPPSATIAQRARPLSLSPASDDDTTDDPPQHPRPHRPRHDPSATKRVTVRKTPEQVRALNIAFEQLGARPSQSDRRRLALEIGLSERIVNTWFRDERSKRKKEGIAASRAQAVAAAATHSRLSANPRGQSDDGDETDMEEDDELMDDDDPLLPLDPLDPPPRKPDNNRHSDVSVYALPGPSTPYRPPMYDYSAAHVGAYPETDPASAQSLPQVSPPLAVRQLNGTRFRNMVREQLRTHRAPHRTSGAVPANHLLSPTYPPSELSSVSEHDGERMFDALSHSPMTNVEPSPVRSEMSLPATPLQNEPPLPISLPPVGSLTHPPEGGWTSSWRWRFYGHTSSMRATLEPAKWTPESSDNESMLGLENVNPISIHVSDYDKYDKPFDAGVKRSPFAPSH